MRRRALSPGEMYPAGVTGVSTRMVRLSTGVSLRLAEAGPADGTPIVFLHGWGASLYMFRHPLELLPSLGFRVIVPDLRGSGLSDKPVTRGAYSADALCGDVAALLDALGVARTALVGQSMGGGVALQFALRAPERLTMLGLINPIGLTRARYLGVARLAPRRAVAAVGRTLAPRAMVRFILRRIAYGDPAKVTERAVDEYWAPTQIPGSVQAARASLSDFDWDPLPDKRLTKLAVETVVIIGRRDRLVHNPDPSRLPGARVETMDGGHCVHEEFPRETYGIIAAVAERAALRQDRR